MHYLPKMSRTVALDLNAQMYESGGFIFGKWKDCRIILYSDSRLDWFFDQTKLAGTVFLKDLRNLISFDGVSASAPQSRPFVPKIMRANLLFSVATDKTAKYYHWFLFESKNDYNKFCDIVCSQIGKTRACQKKSSRRSPSIDPSKRKPRSHSAAISNKLRFLRGINGSQEGSESGGDLGGSTTTMTMTNTNNNYVNRKFLGGRIYGSHTPNPIRRILGGNHHSTSTNTNNTNTTSSVDAMLDKL